MSVMPDRSDDPADESLTADRRDLLLRLARQALEEILDRGTWPVRAIDDPILLRPGAAFVTLRCRDSKALRGCKGEVVPRRSLVESVVGQAISAATDDPRFPPVTRAEVPTLAIEISVLTPMRPIRPEQVELGRHGLLIVCGHRRGLLLPQVPNHHGLDVAGFLDAVSRKAGLPDRAWLDDPQAALYGFGAEVWGEGDSDPS